MSIIVYKDGVMAADTGGWCGEVMTAADEVKIIKTEDGALVGCAGTKPDCDQFRLWAQGGFKPEAKPPLFEDFGAIVVNPDGEVWRYDAKLRRYKPGCQWHVEGCAEGFAFGLLAAGLSAVEVVEMAIKHCAYVGGRVLTLRRGEDEGQAAA